MKHVILLHLIPILYCLFSSKVLAADFVLIMPEQSRINRVRVQHGQFTHGNRNKRNFPKLHWENEPTGTRSFAITVCYADAPAARGKNHWTLFNIPPDQHDLPEKGDQSEELLPEGSV